MQEHPPVEHMLPSFSEAFGSLAHHLFPDGCPEELIEDVWPTRSDRSSVSHVQARQSLASLKQISCRVGFSASEIECLVLTACKTLPWNVRGSKLVDGSSKIFRDFLRFMIPKRGHRVSIFIVTKLVTVQCDTLGRAIICRYLTLCLRSGALTDNARQRLSSFYAIIFLWLPCADSFRLIHALTRRSHVRSNRAKRLRLLYDSAGISSELQKGPLWLLLQLFARYDPIGCGKFLPSSKRNCGALSKHFWIPDQSWEQEFISISQGNDDTPSVQVQDSKNRDARTRATTMEWLENAFDGVHSFSLGLALGQQERRVLRASDLLMDESIRNLILLSHGDGIEMVRLRACLPYMLHEEWFHQPKRSLISKKYNYDDDSSLCSAMSTSDNDDENSGKSDTHEADSQLKYLSVDPVDQRLRILRALASLTSQSSSLLQEADTFLLTEVLPFWDGSDQVGQILCHRLLPFLSPRMFSRMKSQVLCHLAPLIHYGSPRTQYLIIAGALKEIVKQWSVCDMSGIRQKNSNISMSVKERTLRDLIEWTESQILKAMLISDGHELLREGALEFFFTVVEHCPYVVLPGPSLVYQLLLSKAATSIDHLCTILVKYKTLLQQRKQSNEVIEEELQESISLFNCYIWDICSVLWRKSPLPSTDSSEMRTARSKSILFTDIKAETLTHLQEHNEFVSVGLSITHGAAFHSYTRAYLGQREDRSIVGKEKLVYLDFLKAQGLRGIHAFLTTFVASLASREERRRDRHLKRLN